MDTNSLGINGKEVVVLVRCNSFTKDTSDHIQFIHQGPGEIGYICPFYLWNDAGGLLLRAISSK